MQREVAPVSIGIEPTAMLQDCVSDKEEQKKTDEKLSIAVTVRTRPLEGLFYHYYYYGQL
jgi:hypothetical protein